MKKIFQVIAVVAASTCLLSCEEEAVKVASITVTPQTLTLTEGESMQLSATIAPENAELAKIFWHSSNDEVAIVTADGMVTAVKEGDAPVRIIASGGMRAGYCLLTVKAPIVDVTGVSFDPAKAQIYVGETYQLQPLVTPENASDKTVTYKSSNEQVATVSKSTGLVTGVAPGTAEITVKTNDQGKTAVFTITVVKGPQGLNSIGTANCYVIPEAGEFFFTPTKGCSDTSVGKIASVNVVWETVNTSTAPTVGTVISELKYEKEKIWFRAKDVKGNALIAAKDESGTILWSWHIWNLLEPVTEVAIGNAKAMDRNLGALSATGDLSTGLFWEWGRKDPFMGANKPAAGAGLMQATAAVNDGTWQDTGESTGSVEWAIQHPAKWIKGSGATGWDWYFKSPGNSLWLGEGKTIYDPCPPGYIIPTTTSFEGVTQVDFPRCGFLNSNGVGPNNLGTVGAYMTVNNPGEGQKNCMRYAVASDGKLTTASASRGQGASIRCVKIK